MAGKCLYWFCNHQPCRDHQRHSTDKTPGQPAFGQRAIFITDITGLKAFRESCLLYLDRYDNKQPDQTRHHKQDLAP